jgi:lysophospholipase L1-like esterase
MTVRRQDRRGFEVCFILLLGMIFVALWWLRNVPVAPVATVLRLLLLLLLLLQLLLSVVGLYVVEQASRPPSNDAYHYVRWKASNKSDAPTLVCLGDSLTHGTFSAPWVEDIVEHAPSWSKEQPLHVVNCGQNNLVTHTCLHERVDWTLACQPQYVVVMIGTNDCRGVYNRGWRWQLETMWWTPEPLCLDVLECNIESMVQKLVHAHPLRQVGLCTIPPLGEDLRNRANVEVVGPANERIRRIAAKYPDQCALLDVYRGLTSQIRQDQLKWPVRLFFLPAIVFAFPRFLFGTSLKTLGKIINNQVMFEGLHLNETGGQVITTLVVQWLQAKGLSLPAAKYCSKRI